MKEKFTVAEVKFKICLHETVPVYCVVDVKCKRDRENIHVVIKLNKKGGVSCWDEYLECFQEK